MWLHLRLPQHQHPTTTSTTATPRTATLTKVVTPTALGSLDIGTRATTSPELLASILYSPTFCDVTPSMTFPLPLRGDVSAWFYFGFSPVWPFVTLQLFTMLPLRLWGMLEYTCCTRCWLG
jgi:hypothetical protein